MWLAKVFAGFRPVASGLRRPSPRSKPFERIEGITTRSPDLELDVGPLSGARTANGTDFLTTLYDLPFAHPHFAKVKIE